MKVTSKPAGIQPLKALALHWHWATVGILRRFLLLLLVIPLAAQAQFETETNMGSITITGYTGPGGEVTIPGRINGLLVTNIRSYSFRWNDRLTSITIPDSVTTIEALALNGCTALTNVTIPNSVTTIEDSAFSGCTGLTAIEVDALNPAYSSVDGVLFDKNQTRLVRYPAGKTGYYAIPEGVTRVANEAFEGSRNLTTLTIPNSVISIGGGAFMGCGSLTIEASPKPQFTAHPLVRAMLRDIQPTNLYRLMCQITGEEPVLVGNEVVVFTNRFTGSALLGKATQFVFEQLQALGLQVQYQDWEAPAEAYADRNIIGIQPGIGRPEEIVVVCAHFDDVSETSRASGADDNGSGSAAVLTAARIHSR